MRYSRRKKRYDWARLRAVYLLFWVWTWALSQHSSCITIEWSKLRNIRESQKLNSLYPSVDSTNHIDIVTKSWTFNIKWTTRREIKGPYTFATCHILSAILSSLRKETNLAWKLPTLGHHPKDSQGAPWITPPLELNALAPSYLPKLEIGGNGWVNIPWILGLLLGYKNEILISSRTKFPFHRSSWNKLVGYNTSFRSCNHDLIGDHTIKWFHRVCYNSQTSLPLGAMFETSPKGRIISKPCSMEKHALLV